MKAGIIIACLCLATNIFAAEQIVKEDTTPPPAEGAITVDQIQPLVTSQQK